MKFTQRGKRRGCEADELTAIILFAPIALITVIGGPLVFTIDNNPSR